MRVVFDIGGTNTRIAKTENGRISEVRKFQTPQKPGEAVVQIAETVRLLAGEEAFSIAGGVAGVIQNGTILRSPNLPKWDNFPFGEMLREALGTPAALVNDADAAALGEAIYGAGENARIVAYITVGTGVGGGRVVEGCIDSYAYGFEPGHQIVDASNGKTLESLVSGRVLLREFNSYPQVLPRDDYAARVRFLAAGLHNAIVFWSPDILILGGGIINETNGFRFVDIKEALEQLPKIFPTPPEIKMGALGDSAGLFGALALLK